MEGKKFEMLASPLSLFYFSDKFEPYVKKLLCSLIKQDMIVVDIGASTGYYTLLASKIMEESGLVFSFEPHPDRFRELTKNLQINKSNSVKAFNLALSDKKGEIKFESKKGLISYGYFMRTEKDAGAITLKTLTLDSFGIDPDIVKMDVEGAELEVLRGMKEILSKGKVKIICEVHPSVLSFLGYNKKEIEEILQFYNYKIYSISEKGLRESQLHSKLNNYLFIKCQ